MTKIGNRMYLSECTLNTGKSKTIPVSGRGGPQSCEWLRLPHLIDNRLTDGDKVVSLMRRPPSTPRKIPGTHFC
jgi:hypothetical protein